MTQPFHPEVGLQLSIEDLVESIRLSKKSDVSLRFSLRNEEELDNKLKTTILRIVQEQVNNILRHANASRITISLIRTRQHIKLSITDNGHGFDPSRNRSGIGLTNIINRAELFNGKATINSSPGKGCRLQVDFKLIPSEDGRP